MVQTLTIKEIDARIPVIDDRLKVISGELKKQNAELGSTRVLKMPTKLIHNAIYKLEKEQRELESEKSFLVHERENIIKVNVQKVIENATAEFEALREQINPSAIEIIQNLLTVYRQILKHDLLLSLMSDIAPAAGRRFSGIDPSVINIQMDHAERLIYQILNNILAFNGPELLEKFGAQIPDLDLERQKMFPLEGRLTFGNDDAQRTTIPRDDSPFATAA